MSFAVLIMLLSFGASMTATALTPRRKRWKGRHISLPLIRRFGVLRARRLWMNLAFARLAALVWAIFGGSLWPFIVLYALDAARDVDDWLYSDDDERKDRFRSRVKLRMPKPVLLRPAERWSPST